jgi:23S rRNA (guanosine2251-2'-O)-methyltransferase
MAKRKPTYRVRPGPDRQDRPRPGRQERDRAAPAEGDRPQHRPRHPHAALAEGDLRLFGPHAVLAALANPARPGRRLLLTEEVQRGLGPRLDTALAAGNKAGLPREIMSRGEIDRLLPPGTVHQGLLFEAGPLPEVGLDEICRAAEGRERALLLALDQVTDPQNVGATLRAAAAFGALGVIVTERHAPLATGALAKAASGALERVALVRVVNLARALDELKEAGFWCAGLDAGAPQRLDAVRLDDRLALVLGAEGHGLRRLTRERCDRVLRIPMAESGVESLNVATAAAIALYEYVRGAGG